MKRRLEAHLVLRGSRQFDREADYAAFVAQVCRGANALRHQRLAEEVAVLRALPATRYPQAEEIAVRVSSYSTARVKECAYSLPSQLIGAVVIALVTEGEVGFRHGGQEVARYRRRRAKEPAIDYRHVIHSLVRKPGAFAGYIYREELFPRSVFRQAYDRLKQHDAARADAAYVRVLALAAESGEDAVAGVLGQLLRDHELPCDTLVRDRLTLPVRPTPMLASFAPELSDYDQLLEVGT